MIVYKFADGYYIVDTDEFISNDIIKTVICCLLGRQTNNFSIFPLDIRKILCKHILYFSDPSLYVIHSLTKYSSKIGTKKFEEYLTHQFSKKDDVKRYSEKEWLMTMIGRLISNKKDNWLVMLHLLKRADDEHPKILNIVRKVFKQELDMLAYSTGYITFPSRDKLYIIHMDTLEDMGSITRENLIKGVLTNRIVILGKIYMTALSTVAGFYEYIINNLVTFNINDEMFNEIEIDKELASVIILCNKMYIKNCSLSVFNGMPYNKKDPKTCCIS